MMLRRYRAVVFDFFGTLVPNFILTAHKAVLRQMADVLNAPGDLFVDRWLAMFDLRATGAFPSVRDNIVAVCRELGVSPDDKQYGRAVALRYDFERAHVTPRSDALRVLRELRGSALKTGLITDCSRELPDMRDETVFASLFDAAIFSCRVGVRKPDRRIYEVCCEELQVAPAECLYVGDGGSNELAGAAAAGMCAVRLIDCGEPAGEDVHRIDFQDWHGDSISYLLDVLALVQRPNGKEPWTPTGKPCQ